MFKYKLKKISKRKLVVWLAIILVFSLSIGGLTSYYASYSTLTNTSSGISGDTVYVNDYESDWNYYQSLNYTEVTNRSTLPGTSSLNIYGSSTLVAVQLTYDGTDQNDSSLVGYVSTSEQQSKYVYYKYYYIDNGYVTIELIDNPFSDLPTGRGFNGWVCDSINGSEDDCSSVTFSYDDDYYTRYLTIPSSLIRNNSGDNTLVINLKTNWTDATTVTNPTSVSGLKTKKMTNLDGVISSEKIYTGNYTFSVDVYEATSLNRNETAYNVYYGGQGNTNNFQYSNSYTCNNRGGSCTVYSLSDDTYYDATKTYYYFVANNNNGYYTRYTLGTDKLVAEYYELVTEFSNSSITNGVSMEGYYYLSSYDSDSDDASLYYNASGKSCADVFCSGTAYKLIQPGESISVTYTLQYGEKYATSEDECTTTINVWKTCSIYRAKTDEDGNIIYKTDEDGNYVYDEDGNIEIDYDESNPVVVNVNSFGNYYYLVTRDTNIIYLTSDKNLSDINGYNNSAHKPFTILGNGSVTLTNSNKVTIYADMRIENVKVKGSGYTEDSSSSSNYISASSYNLKIGRNVVSSNTESYFVSGGIVGGSAKTIVESGFYGYLQALPDNSTENYHGIVVYGSDYDRVNGYNSNLIVEYQALSSDYGNHNSDTLTPVSEMTIKSGTYGNYIITGYGTSDTTNKQYYTSDYYTYGVYAGGISNGSSTGYRTLKIEGGRIFSVNGGPCIATNTTSVVIGIYMTGGDVDNIVGGAGTSVTYGKRLVSISGGLVRNAVAGASNSYEGNSTSRELNGDTLVYVGGSATLGGTTPSEIDSDGLLYGVSSQGSVFGAGLGKSDGGALGAANSTHVIINGGTINGDVYGGGNYGKAGYGSNTYNTVVDIYAGTINGSVFGGANSNGFASSNYKNGSITVNMSGGTAGYVYGGSNSTGTIYGTVNVNLTGGTITYDAFGGGYGSSTVVYGTVNVNTNVTDNSKLSVKNIYGGSALGKVNSVNTYTTNVTINGGTISEAVYGAGKGDDETAPETTGKITVTVKSGDINNVFGGNNVNGTLTQTEGNLNVIINGGTIGNVYGGSNGKEAGATYTNVTVTGGTINTAVYGGGAFAKTVTSSKVTIGNSSTEFESVIPAVYGGGENAVVGTTNVYINAGSKVENVYGGSNESGTVTTSNVTASDGIITCNAYGGGNVAEVTTSNITLSGTTFNYSLADEETVYSATCGSAYGGGNEAAVETSNITLKGSSLINVFGGSNTSGVVTKSNVVIDYGTANTVFGGNNVGGYTESANVTVEESGGTLTLDNVFGGSNGAGASIGNKDEDGYSFGSTKTEIISGTITQDVFGGGNEANVYGSTEVNVYDGTMRSVYGGGNSAFIGYATASTNGAYYSGDEKNEGATVVNVVGGTINKNVYGSGNASFVYGDTTVNIGTAAIDALELDVSNPSLTISGTVFGGSETNADDSATFDYSFNGVEGNTTVNVDGSDYVSDNVSTLSIVGSLYGWGNNSAVSDTSVINVDNFGTEEYPVTITSIQRATNVYITDSFMELSGTRDRASTSSSKYTFVRIDALYLLGSESSSNDLNGSTLYLATGSTYLKEIYSGIMKDGEYVEQATSIDGGSYTNSNSDNKIYMYVNKILSISNSESPSYESSNTSAGSVHGMTFLGMYLHGSDNSFITGIYDSSISGDVDSSTASEISDNYYTFVYGKHDYDADEQIVSNGYYSNYLSDDGSTVSADYVGVTPANANYYKWVVGEEHAEIVVDLQATRYSVDGVVNKTITLDQLKELVDDQLVDWHDAKMQIESVSTDAFGASGDVKNSYETYLVDKSTISTYNDNDINETADGIVGDGIVDANQYFSLSMGTTTSGWLDNYKTNIYSANESAGYGTNFCEITSDDAGECTGSSSYLYDSTTSSRTLSFWLYYSKNLDFSVAKNVVEDEPIEISLGTVYIYTTFYNQNGDQTDASSVVDVVISVNISMYEGDIDSYGKAIAPGKKYEAFQNRTTNIASDGSFSIYQSLSLDLNGPILSSKTGETWSVEKLYNEDAYRYLNSSYNFPVGTKITMIDLVDGKQYYLDITDEIYNELASNTSGSYQYMLEDFIKMGSTSSDNHYDDSMGENSKYIFGDSDNQYAIEEFIFTVDFSGVDEDNIDASTYYLYMVLAKKEEEDGSVTQIIGPSGTPDTEMIYTIYKGISSVIVTDGELEDDTIYVGESLSLELDTSLISESSTGSVSNVSDTIYDDYKLGAKISILRAKIDGDGNVVKDDDNNIVYEQVTQDLFGTVVTINGVSYYPQTDGTIRLQLAGRITDVISDIEIDFANSSMDYGDYILVVETFASYDGLYYGDLETTVNNFEFTLINNDYGLDAVIPEEQLTRDVNTGLDINGSSVAQFVVSERNGLADPNLKISLQRRTYGSDSGSAYTYTYEDISLSEIASDVNISSSAESSGSNILGSCYDSECLIYNLGSISKDLDNDVIYYVNVTLNSSLRSGTYRVIFTMYDGDTEIGSVYEYLIVRSLDVDEVVEGSGN